MALAGVWDFVNAALAARQGNRVRERAQALEATVLPLLRPWDVKRVASIVSQDYWRGQVPDDAELGFAPWLIDAAIAWWQNEEGKRAEERAAAAQAAAEAAERARVAAEKSAARSSFLSNAKQARETRLRETIERIESLALARARAAAPSIGAVLIREFGESARTETEQSRMRLENAAKREAAARGEELRRAEQERLDSQGSIDDDPELAQFAGLPLVGFVGPLLTVAAPFVFRYLTARKKARRRSPK